MMVSVGALPCFLLIGNLLVSTKVNTASIQYSQFNNQIHNYDEFVLVVNPIIHLGPRPSVASNNVRIEGGYGC